MKQWTTANNNEDSNDYDVAIEYFFRIRRENGKIVWTNESASTAKHDGHADDVIFIQEAENGVSRVFKVSAASILHIAKQIEKINKKELDDIVD